MDIIRYLVVASVCVLSVQALAAINNPTPGAVAADQQAVIVDATAQSRRLTGCDAGYGGTANSAIHDFSTGATTVNYGSDALGTHYAAQCQTDMSWAGFSSSSTVGAISTTMSGTGTATLDHGNCYTAASRGIPVTVISIYHLTSGANGAFFFQHGQLD
jgi:hypothetical protein